VLRTRLGQNERMRAVGTTELRAGWRDEAWQALVRGPWDILVVGGGITGAGIARRAAQAGLRTALVERRDFAWGTSSRSSKLVHGGLRYLAHGQMGVVRDSVAGREALLGAAPGLVEELGFLMPTFRGVSPGRWMLTAGLWAYDVLAGRRTHRHLSRARMLELVPAIRAEGLTGGFRYGDATTDDARLVLRVLADARAAGAVMLSYAPADRCLRDGSGRVAGVALRDDGPNGAGRTAEVTARVVVNATGAAADRLRGDVGKPPRIRPLRGSHLFFPARILPLAQPVGSGHPADRRPVFAYPWDAVTIVGTTDVDEAGDQAHEPRISAAEAAYLEDWLAFEFPSLGLKAELAVASMAGVRPVIGTGKADPSAESREHVVWEEDGLVTVTGGKLTTFDAIARDALHRIGPRLGGAGKRAGGALRDGPAPVRKAGPLDVIVVPPDVIGQNLEEAAMRRLVGRHGRETGQAIVAAGSGETAPIEGTRDRWLDIRWAARSEAVVHLDDLLLRRVRLGLQLPEGGAAVLGRVRSIAQPELGWDDSRWAAEEAAYQRLWATAYAPPSSSQPG
jgi:glycerol-3-phosphate dehydrogenase